ncbi:MAG: hypothetical protein LBF90_00690 [Prevotellaceae bacterium]|jgi:hypothetical protein|nr:hypothetical protein [Prevotellaceae bacterium]
MKKPFFFSLALTVLGLLSQPLAAQTEAENALVEPLAFPKNELKINALMLFVPVLEMHYEYLINNENAAGLSAHVQLGSDYFIPFQALGFYRFYFGKKPAAGFFVELNASAYVFNQNWYGEESETADRKYTNRFTGGFGLTLGKKYLTKRNVVVEIFYGVGRSVFHESFYLNFGITVGKRF